MISCWYLSACALYNHLSRTHTVAEVCGFNSINTLHLSPSALHVLISEHYADHYVWGLCDMRQRTHRWQHSLRQRKSKCPEQLFLCKMISREHRFPGVCKWMQSFLIKVIVGPSLESCRGSGQHTTSFQNLGWSSSCPWWLHRSLFTLVNEGTGEGE